MCRRRAFSDPPGARATASVDGVEWALDGHSKEGLTALRHEIAAYLRRHATTGSDLAGAEIVVAELLANAVEHAPGPAWARVIWTGDRPRLEVHDLGGGFELDPVLPPASRPRGRGLYLADAFVDDLARASKRAGGSVVSATLPVRRARPASDDPPRPTVSPLPSSEEALEDGTFGREAFLRALLVELAEATEAREGPDAVVALVAQVGANVGGRMEEAYRRVRSLTGRLSPDEMGDLYVRLKGAMGGDFYVVEADEHRIVLGNRRCPFGSVVRRQPGLCRMTSSVLGGIAARNTGGSAVTLEERIAVGDPECRIVVWPRPPAPGRTATRRRSSRPIPNAPSSRRAGPRCTARSSSTRRPSPRSCATSCGAGSRSPGRGIP